SHQIGLDADIWLTPMPSRRLSVAERDEMSATDVVAPDGNAVDEAWTPQHQRLLEAFAREPQVARIFVNPAIKRALCHEAGPDRAARTTTGPGGGHNDRSHCGLPAPAGREERRNPAPPPPGGGSGRGPDWWFTPEGRHPPRAPAKPLLVSDLPL